MVINLYDTDILPQLTGNVTQTIEKAKKKIAGMPHAKKELNPLWGLLAGKDISSALTSERC